MEPSANYSAGHLRKIALCIHRWNCTLPPLSNMALWIFSYQETEVHQKHPENYQVYEDGGSCKVCPGWAGAEASSSVRNRLLGWVRRSVHRDDVLLVNLVLGAFVHFQKPRCTWEEELSSEGLPSLLPHEIGLWVCLFDIFLTANWCREAQPTVGCAIPGQEDLSCI